MPVVVEIPDRIADILAAGQQDPTRSVLEAVALEGYRADRLTESDIRQLLGFETRMEVHGFLKGHGVPMHYTSADLRHDTAVALEVALRIEKQHEAGSEQPE